MNQPPSLDQFILSNSTLQSSNKMASIVRKVVNTEKCPKVPAPFNQAVVAGQTVYCSGIMGMELGSLKLVNGGAGPEAAKALENLAVLLEAAGSSLANVVKTTILLTDIKDYGVVNVEYRKVFSDSFPARTCFAVKSLPMGASVEIEAIALAGDVIHTSTKLNSKM
ncbi:rutC family protein UK114-like [Aedes albopictus]|uniref:Translation initiation inhibitor n=1 Tax=Aedes albopictus TaxID=7160 RepID=A0ABM1YNA4_AEDAL